MHAPAIDHGSEVLSTPFMVFIQIILTWQDCILFLCICVQLFCYCGRSSHWNHSSLIHSSGNSYRQPNVTPYCYSTTDCEDHKTDRHICRKQHRGNRNSSVCCRLS